jgi:hypothetical protein
MDKIYLNIVEEFSNTPGTRDSIESDYPGEEFLNKILLPKFQEAIDKKVKLVVNLDGPAGYATSFLEAAFGGLVRHYNDIERVKKTIEFIGTDDPFLIEDIHEYMRNALKTER